MRRSFVTWLAPVLLLSACAYPGSSPTSADPSSASGSSPSPARSASAAPPREPDPTEGTSQLVGQLLDRLASPGLTYRVRSETALDVGAEGGMTSVFGAYDVAGSAFGGWVRLTNAVVRGAPEDRRIVVLDDTLHDLGFLGPASSSPALDGASIPDRLQRLTAGDLELIDSMDDGTFLFRVEPWIGGSPAAVLFGLGAIAGDGWLDQSVIDHDTRLIVDADGVPVQLMSEFTVAGASALEMRGTIHDEYSAFGLYVSIEEPGSSPYGSETSYDVQIGVDDHTMVTEPWIRLPADPANAATVDIEFVFPAEGVSLGIEGAIGFVRAHDAQGDVIFDDLMGFDGASSVLVPAGSQTLVPYFRSCDGWCGLLDWPNDFCSIDADLDAGGRHRLVVTVVDYETASCEFDGGAV